MDTLFDELCALWNTLLKQWLSWKEVTEHPEFKAIKEKIAQQKGIYIV